MKTLALNSDEEIQRGIERWENEGGLIRFSTNVLTHLNRPPDVGPWARDLSNNADEAGLGSLSDADANFLVESTERRRVMKKSKRAVVLLGPPASGKTTLVRSMAAVNRIFIIETGNLLTRA